MKKSDFFMKCPHCDNSISLLRVKEEFYCPNCGSLLRCGNYMKILLIALAICAAITFVLDFVRFSFFVIVLYNVVIFLVVMLKFAKKLDCLVLRESADKNAHKGNKEGDSNGK
jgi:hypothetical protein